MNGARKIVPLPWNCPSPWKIATQKVPPELGLGFGLGLGLVTIFRGDWGDNLPGGNFPSTVLNIVGFIVTIRRILVKLSSERFIDSWLLFLIYQKVSDLLKIKLSLALLILDIAKCMSNNLHISHQAQQYWN